MSGEDPFGNLQARLGTYGPFPASRRRIVLFSSGNDREDHSPVMASGSDTFFAQAFCSSAALRTGVHYLAHVPFTTDPSGDTFMDFCTVALSREEFFEATADCCAMVLDAVKPRPEGVCTHISWHGQQINAERIDEFARPLSVREAHLTADIVVESHRRFSEQDYQDSSSRDLVHEGIAGRHTYHAGFFDYCVPEALGHLDRPKLE